MNTIGMNDNVGNDYSTNTVHVTLSVWNAKRQWRELSVTKVCIHSQVKVWFQNRRTKEKRIQQEDEGEGGGGDGSGGAGDGGASGGSGGGGGGSSGASEKCSSASSTSPEGTSKPMEEEEEDEEILEDSEEEGVGGGRLDLTTGWGPFPAHWRRAHLKPRLRIPAHISWPRHMAQRRAEGLPVSCTTRTLSTLTVLCVCVCDMYMHVHL